MKEEDGVYVHVNDPNAKKGSSDDCGGPFRQYGRGPHSKVSHEVGEITHVSVVRPNVQLPRNKKIEEAILVSECTFNYFLFKSKLEMKNKGIILLQLY